MGAMRFLKEQIWELAHRTPPFKGKERLVAFLSRPSGSPESRILRAGVRWEILGHDINEFVLAVRRDHSDAIARILEREMSAASVDTFWDVGANIGTVALPLVAAFPKLNAFLFEPSAEVASRLIRNLANNPELAPRVTVMNLALSNASGLSEFFVSNENFNSGTGGLGKSHNRMGFAVRVAVQEADKLVAENHCPPPQLVKIDVEGFEFEVLQGMQQVLAQHKPTVLFEHSVYRIQERGRKLSEVTDFFRANGYEVYPPESLIPVSEIELQGEMDLLARPRG